MHLDLEIEKYIDKEVERERGRDGRGGRKSNRENREETKMKEQQRERHGEKKVREREGEGRKRETKKSNWIFLINRKKTFPEQTAANYAVGNSKGIENRPAVTVTFFIT